MTPSHLAQVDALPSAAQPETAFSTLNAAPLGILKSVELFAGCGGLGMGVSAAGFHPEFVVEWNEVACATLVANKDAGLEPISRWKIENKDVRLIDYASVGSVDLVSGGPPCQPFSIGGKHKGPADHRDMWLEAIRAVRELAPRAFLFENVQGLLRPAFADYLTYVRTHLEWPEISSRDDEAWPNHLARLKAYAAGRRDGPRYHVRVKRVNAADYGAPQWRNRVIIAGVRTDLVDDWSLPAPTHSIERLLWDQWVTGDYWKRHEIADRTRPEPDTRVKAMVKRIEKMKVEPAELPWVTVRDAVGALPPPLADREVFPAHVLWPGARAYRKHTGSSWDMPSKALKAGAHGVPGGENMLALGGSEVRYFTIREMARLQGFPDRYILPGKWASSMRQLGNAVPVQLATAMAERVAEVLNGAVRERAAA